MNFFESIKSFADEHYEQFAHVSNVVLSDRFISNYIFHLLCFLAMGKTLYLPHPGCGQRTLESLKFDGDWAIITDTLEEQKRLTKLGYKNVLVLENNPKHKEVQEPEPSEEERQCPIFSWAFVTFSDGEWNERLSGLQNSVFFQTSGTIGMDSRFVEIPFPWLWHKSKYLANLFAIDQHDTGIVFSSPCFIQVFWTILVHICRGSRLVLSEFNPQIICSLMIEHRVSTLVTTASVLRGLMGYPSFKSVAPSLARVIVGGDYINVATFHNLKQLLPDTVYCNIYGCTELSAINVLTEPSTLKSFDTDDPGIGRPAPSTQLKILPSGELCCKTCYASGSYAFGGIPYLDENGFFHTGDLVYSDMNGNLYYRGRCNGIINCNGQKINAQEIEELLLKLDGIIECVVIGRQDALYGEIAECFIVADSAVTEDGVREYLSTQLDRNQMPQRFGFLSSLPKTVSGKTIRNAAAYPIQEQNDSCVRCVGEFRVK